MTSLGIEPATVRFVAQCLNELNATACPQEGLELTFLTRL
jgi:hypothetical protein